MCFSQHLFSIHLHPVLRSDQNNYHFPSSLLHCIVIFRCTSDLQHCRTLWLQQNLHLLTDLWCSQGRVMIQISFTNIYPKVQSVLSKNLNQFLQFQMFKNVIRAGIRAARPAAAAESRQTASSESVMKSWKQFHLINQKSLLHLASRNKTHERVEFIAQLGFLLAFFAP